MNRNTLARAIKSVVLIAGTVILCMTPVVTMFLALSRAAMTV